MPSATIYKINKKGYLLHADKKTLSGFYTASSPFIQITEVDASIITIVNAIKKVLSVDDSIRVSARNTIPGCC